MIPEVFDFSPVLMLVVIGAAVALVPLLWVAVTQRKASAGVRLRALCLTTLFLTFDLVIFGAFTRLSDSGLGCPDWPGCYGHASPVGAQAMIASAQQTLPSGPVTHQKAWVEMLHRYLASGVGALILVMFVLSVMRPRAERFQSAVLAGITFLWVCLQGAFGALTVTMKLFPAIVSLHLLGGMVLLVLLTVQWSQLEPASHALPVERLLPAPSSLRAHAMVAMGLLMLQIALGAWVSTNYAVLACSEFPACQGQWWPDMNFRLGFELWRELGQTAAGVPIPFEALTAIHMVHRLAALVVAVVLGWLAWRMHRTAPLRWHGDVLAGLLLMQIASGLGNVLLGWPLLAALMHTAGAAALVILLTRTLWLCRNAAQSLPVTAFTELRLHA